MVWLFPSFLNFFVFFAGPIFYGGEGVTTLTDILEILFELIFLSFDFILFSEAFFALNLFLDMLPAGDNDDDGFGVANA